jgi:glycosyltransferase involved in cell wall biosynthesis
VRAVPAPAGDPPPRAGAIYLGRLHPAKRVLDALEAWARLPPALAPATLRIVGSGDPAYTQQLKEAAQRLGIADRVVFYGSVSEERKWELLRGAELFVFPSGEEGWGIAIAEAMTAGLPCVTYDLPVYRELFPRGRVEVPLGDVDSLATACAALLNEPGRLEQLAAEARALAPDFTWDKAAHAEMEALRSVVPAP